MASNAQQTTGAQPTATSAPSAEAVQDEGWPRSFEAEGHEVVLHQPQIDKWDDYRTIHIRAAIVIRKEGAEASDYGAVTATASTAVDHEKRLVFVGPRKVQNLQFPGMKPEQVERLRTVMLAALPDEQQLTISLDRVLATVVQGDHQKAREAQVNLDPPPIFASQTPAILVMFAGRPRFEKAADSGLLYAVNTNWDIFLDVAAGTYYLLNEDHWLATKDLEQGKWAPASKLPPGLSKLPPDENWADVRKCIPGKTVPVADAVFVSTGPAELIVTDGPPEFEPIPGTKLLMVNNTESKLFMLMTDQQYYFLTAGRWFRAKSPAGPWLAATRDLPPEFTQIPEDSKAGDVLASVPGTQQAEEAVIQASIPRTATVNRKDAIITVKYDGEPKFVVIQDTTVRYAVNTPNRVFLVNGHYYCCHDGVWFDARSAGGPWLVCAAVPAEIYTIPPSHPTYPVTYVVVKESTPDVVVVQSGSGYSGQYVAAGVVLFGAGMIAGAILADDDDCWRYHYPTAYFSYGCGAHYSHYHGGFYAGHHRSYGPYGGAGGWAGYNPATGIYSRGAYRHGPAGSASVRTAYNPWTGNSAGRVGASTPYASWGRSVVTDGDDWIKGGHRSGARGTVGGVVTSEGTGIVAGKGRYGQGAAVAKDKDGDLYVGNEGNVYKRDDDGNWSQRENGEWKKPEGAKPTPRTTSAGQLRSVDDAASRAQATGTSSNQRASAQQGASAAGRSQGASTYQDLDRQARSRDYGSSSAQRASQQRSASPARNSRGGGASRGGGRGR